MLRKAAICFKMIREEDLSLTQSYCYSEIDPYKAINFGIGFPPSTKGH